MKTHSRVLLAGMLIVLALFWFGQRNRSNDLSLTNKGSTITTLSAIAALSAHQIWSVGAILPTKAKFYQPLIQYWDGIHWSVVSSPSAPGQTLSAVTALSTDDAWAVGSVIEHWDGKQWHLITHPTGSLTAVAAITADNVWAVGFHQYDRSRNYQTLIEHWDGTSWKVVRSPNGNQNDNRLTAMTVVSANDIWASGSFTTPLTGDEHLLIVHWDGSTWSKVSSPYVHPADWTSNSLKGMTVISKEDIWAVGGSFIPLTSKYQLLFLHWNGRTWQQIPGPRLGSACCPGLFAITAISATNIWAVGAGSNPYPLIVHWDGSIWSTVASPSPPVGATSSLLGVAAVSTRDIWAVGTADITNSISTHFIEHWDGTTWQLVESP